MVIKSSPTQSPASTGLRLRVNNRVLASLPFKKRRAFMCCFEGDEQASALSQIEQDNATSCAYSSTVETVRQEVKPRCKRARLGVCSSDIDVEVQERCGMSTAAGKGVTPWKEGERKLLGAEWKDWVAIEGRQYENEIEINEVVLGHSKIKEEEGEKEVEQLVRVEMQVEVKQEVRDNELELIIAGPGEIELKVKEEEEDNEMKLLGLGEMEVKVKQEKEDELELDLVEVAVKQEVVDELKLVGPVEVAVKESWEEVKKAIDSAGGD